MHQQILFRSEDQSSKTFENFYAAENSNILSALLAFLSEDDAFGCFYIYGDSGCGKTHLLESAVNAVAKKGQYLDAKTQSWQLRQISNETDYQLLAIDNMEKITGHETDMMLLFETIRQRNNKLVVSSKFAPMALPLSLRDLCSRFVSGQVYELKILNDIQKARALELRASLRGFELADDVIRYVINRYPRDFNTLFNLLDRLDDASLENQRKITVPFIRKLESEHEN